MKVWETGMAGCKGWQVDNQEMQTNWKVSSVVGHNSNVTWQVPPIWTAALLSAWLQEILGVAQDYYKSTLKWAHLTYKVKVLTKMMCVCVACQTLVWISRFEHIHVPITMLLYKLAFIEKCASLFCILKSCVLLTWNRSLCSFSWAHYVIMHFW